MNIRDACYHMSKSGQCSLLYFIFKNEKDVIYFKDMYILDDPWKIFPVPISLVRSEGWEIFKEEKHEEETKPCIYCGQKITVNETETDYPFIECTNRECFFGRISSTKEESIKKYNEIYNKLNPIQPSRLLSAGHQMAKGLHTAGIIDDKEMREFDSLCKNEEFPLTFSEALKEINNDNTKKIQSESTDHTYRIVINSNGTKSYFCNISCDTYFENQEIDSKWRIV